MYTLFLKEIRSFLTSLIGYVVIGVFVTSIGCYMWIIPNESTGFNVLENGFANLDALFIIAPWIYLFLIPAITMRSFSEEKKTGTMELLLTRPLSELQIICAKYFASVVLVFISLLPTLIYYYSVYQLGYPKGNLDTGGLLGSYLGLLCLGAAFAAVGVFGSIISDSQVVAFITSLLLCFLFYISFNIIADSGLFGKYDYTVQALGMNIHYISMSRGVIDTRDVVYFVSLIIVFIQLSLTILKSRKW